MADIVKHGMMDHVSLASRISLQSAANEVNRLLCMMASARAGHQIEEIMQVSARLILPDSDSQSERKGMSEPLVRLLCVMASAHAGRQINQSGAEGVIRVHERASSITCCKHASGLKLACVRW